MYGTLEDMIRKYGFQQMAILSVADSSLPDEPQQERIDAALADAASRIDSYLSRRYRTPVQNPPLSIIDAGCVIAHYRLSQGGDRTPSEQTKKDYDDSIAWLQKIAEGKANLNIPEVSGASSGEVISSDRERIFDYNTLKDW